MLYNISNQNMNVATAAAAAAAAARLGAVQQCGSTYIYGVPGTWRERAK